MLQYRVFETRIVEVSVFLRRNNIQFILIKGWAAAQFYPETSQRRFSDVDLMVAPQNYNEALKCLKDYPENYLIDLHRGARQLDSLSFEELYANSQTVKCGESEIQILRPEDHLRILCVHWLTDGGADKEKLWDIYYAVARRPKNFDWDRCLNSDSSTRKRWILCTIGLAHRYLGLDLENTPLAENLPDIPGWLLEALEKEWQSDVFLRPLHTCLRDRKDFFRQIKKRIPPNSIQATISMEGEFDDKSRVRYQIGNVFQRLFPSLKRIGKNLVERSR